MTKIHMKLATAFWCGLAALSAPAAECARMRVPDSLKAILRPDTGAIKLPVPGGGHVWVTNYNCGDGTDEYQDVPVPVRTAAARDAAIQSAPEDRLILAEISGTTLFAVQEDFDFDNEIDGEPVVAFGGVAIVKGYFFEMEISAPRNRGLDGTVRELLRQVTFLPPEDGNAEPPVPVLTNARAKAPPMKIEDMTGWRSKVKQFTRDPKAAAAEPAVAAEPEMDDEPIEIMSDPAREAKLLERRKDPARAAAAAKFLLDL